MDIFLGVVLGLVILIVLVVLHELGHAIAARRNGVVVEEFGIGFPPKAWGKKLKNGIVFSLNWLPLGGFVKLQGEYDSASKPGDYGASSFWVKTKILFAGVFVNWVTAAILFTIIAFFGLPQILPNQFSIASDATKTYGNVTIVDLVNDYPAEKAGLKSGDKIISFNGTRLESTSQFIDLTKEFRGKSTEIVYNRDGNQYTATVNLRGDGDRTYFGASLGQQETVRSTWSAPIVGVGVTVQFTFETLKGLGVLISDLVTGLVMKISPSASDQAASSEKLSAAAQSVAGPIGILGVIFPQAGKGGLISIIMLTAIISMTLAVMNLLPIPSLDGGRWFVTALFKILRKPLTKSREEKIHGTGFLILMLLVVIITISDVTKIFN